MVSLRHMIWPDRAIRRTGLNGNKSRCGSAVAVYVGVAATVALCSAAMFFVAGSGLFKPRAKLNLLTATVVRAPLELKVVERGSLESAANVTLRSEVEGANAIIKIVEEGTQASKGQLLVELDSSTLRSSQSVQQILVKTAETALDQSQKAVEIQKNLNETNIAAGKLKYELAQLDLEKYRNGEHRQLQNSIAGEITLAEEDYARAKEYYQFTKRLSKKGYVGSSNVEAERVALTKAEIGLQAAQEKLRLLNNYEHPRQLAEKTALALDTKRDQTRIANKAAAALIQAQSLVNRHLLTTQIERLKLERINGQIEACTIFAPQDGLVVYANEKNGRGSSQDRTIRERALVRQRQPIINLPDVTRMQVNARIHESKIDLVAAGLPAQIRVDALPGRVFEGEVTSVSLVPLSANWPNVDLQEYSTIVGVHSSPETLSLKPGLTAEVEILIERLTNVLQLPIQCVVERGGRHFAFVLDDGEPVRRELITGSSNEVVVQIKEGLDEGEVVVENPRSALSEMLDDLEQEVPADAGQPMSDDSSADQTVPNTQPGPPARPADSNATPTETSPTSASPSEVAAEESSTTRTKPKRSASKNRQG